MGTRSLHRDPRRVSARAPRRRRRGRARNPLSVMTLAAVAAIVALLVDGGADAQPTLPKSAIRVQIGGTPDSRPVAPGFVGLSIEYRSALSYFGSDPRRPDPVFVQLVRNLTPGQSPVIRFGGDTTDWTWWPTPGVAKPLGIRYTLGRRWVQATEATARALNARLVLGINFESDSRAIAATEASALLRGIGRRYIAGFELGNEPEVYGSLGWYESPSGRPILGRSPSYGFDSYLTDYAAVLRGLPRGVPVIGPASGAPAWLTGLPRYLNSNPRVQEVTFHRYPLHRCFTARHSPAFPTIANLLAPVASSGPATSLQSAVDVAHAHGLPFRSDELNSVSCGGKHGVSDTFASALWALDTLFNMARVGVDGVNLHTFQKAVYEPFAVSHAGGRWLAEVRPMYYGLLMFTRAAPPGSRLLPAAFHAPNTLRIWATRGRDHRVRIVLINDSRRRPVTVAVRSPGAGTATGQRLRAAHANSASGVSLGGQSFTPATAGRLAGAARTFTLGAVQRRFVVRLPAASATLLTVGPETRS